MGFLGKGETGNERSLHLGEHFVWECHNCAMTAEILNVLALLAALRGGNQFAQVSPSTFTDFKPPPECKLKILNWRNLLWEIAPKAQMRGGKLRRRCLSWSTQIEFLKTKKSRTSVL
jgi:hypothetical protein